MAGDQSNEITVNNSGNVEGNVTNKAESGSETKTKQSTDSKGDNTVMWIILAVVGVLVIGGVGYLATKRGGLSGGESVAPVSVTQPSVVASTHVPSRIPSIVSSSLSSF